MVGNGSDENSPKIELRNSKVPVKSKPLTSGSSKLLQKPISEGPLPAKNKRKRKASKYEVHCGDVNLNADDIVKWVCSIVKPLTSKNFLSAKRFMGQGQKWEIRN